MRSRGVPSRSSACAAAGFYELQARHQPVSYAKSCDRARRSSCGPAAPRRWPARQRHLSLGRISSSSRSPGRDDVRSRADPARPSPGRGLVLGRPARSSAGRRPSARLRDPTSPAARFPKTEKNTASKASTCAGSETNTARAVECNRWRVIGRTVSARAESAARPVCRVQECRK